MEKQENDNLYDTHTFCEKVERLVRYSDLTYMESLMHLIEEENFEIDSVVQLISPSIKKKLKAEGINLNLLEGKKTKKIKRKT